MSHGSLLSMWMVMCLLVTSPAVSGSQLIGIKCGKTCDKKYFQTSTIAMNVFEPSSTPKAGVLYIKGGDSLYRWRTNSHNRPRFPVGRAVSALSEHDIVVVMPDVASFSETGKPGRYTAGNRDDVEYLQQYESVIDWIHHTYQIPVILMGHSNGAMNVVEIYKYLDESRRKNKVFGVIWAGQAAKTFTDFSETNFAFIGHPKDGCLTKWGHKWTHPYDRAKRQNPNAVLIEVKTASGVETGDCNNKFHYFTDAENEVVEKLSDTIHDWLATKQ